MGHLECQVLTEQRAKCEESFLGIWGDFREEEVEGIADGPRGLKSLIAGDSDRKVYSVFHFMDNNCYYLLYACYVLSYITSQ